MHELIALYEKFYFCHLNKGYIRIKIKGSIIVARIAEIKQATNDRYDRFVTLEATDIYGMEISRTTFKLSQVKECVELRILDINI